MDWGKRINDDAFRSFAVLGKQRPEPVTKISYSNINEVRVVVVVVVPKVPSYPDSKVAWVGASCSPLYTRTIYTRLDVPFGPNAPIKHVM